jgi:thiol-disulfide isomerase/thioredoxin
MQSESKEPLLNIYLKAILVSLIAVIIICLILFRDLFFQSTYLLKSFGESSVDPQVAFKNNKPTFLEFYAEWCEVCKEMAPKVSALKEEYEKDINFVFLNVDNMKWENYIRKFDVNGIPQINLFDREGNLKSTFIGKQGELSIRESLDNFERDAESQELNFNPKLSTIKENKNNEIAPRSHG